MISKFEVKITMGKIFKKHNPLQEYSVKIYKIHPYFYERYEKKIQIDNNGHRYILFKIDIYFSEYCLPVTIDEKGFIDRDLIFEEKRQKLLEKKLDCKFITINANNNLDYEISNIHSFIEEFKNEKIKNLEKHFNIKKKV